MKQFLSLLSVAAWLAVGCIDLDGDEILPDEGSLTGGLVVDPVSESTFETSIIAAGRRGEHSLPYIRTQRSSVGKAFYRYSQNERGGYLDYNSSQ